MTEQQAVKHLLKYGELREDKPDTDSIKYYTHIAFDEWGKCAWSKDYDKNVFNDYILPYAIASEPVEYYWREHALKSYRQYLAYDIDDVRKACRIVAEEIHFKEDNSFWNKPLQSYSTSSLTQTGKCDDGCIYKAVVMRSLGIPVSMETIPYWGDHNNGHSFNALIMPDGSSVGFNDAADLKNRLNLQRKIPKIYRHTFYIDTDSFLYRQRDKEWIPAELRDYSLYDVTDCYELPLCDFTVNIGNDVQSELAYLAVFSPMGWRPVTWAQIKDKKATFTNIGTGFLYDSASSNAGEDIGNGIVYLPVYYSEYGEQLTIDYPCIINPDNTVTSLKPDFTHKQTITIKRKFPRKSRTIEFASDMVGGYFEASNDPDFSDSEILHYILDTPSSHLQKIKSASKMKYKFVRYKKTKGGISVGDIKFTDENQNKIDGKLIADESIIANPTLKNAFDNNCLTYFDSRNIPGVWIGLEFRHPVCICNIEYCPRTDDNDICPGDEYELFYWDNDWISLGRKVSTGYQLDFSDVPGNALLWVRDITKGQEERPFIFENKQIWF